MITTEQALASASDTRALRVGTGILGGVADLFAEQFPGKTAVVIADHNTNTAAGKQVSESLRAARIKEHGAFVFEEQDLHAEYPHVQKLVDFLSGVDAIPIAVGSGTINDMTKLAAHLTGRKYMCVATAASMDGYTAYGASILQHGSKQTFECPAPAAVLADIGIIANAPEGMNASGYADLLAKMTAGADWIIADALGVERIDATAWAMVQEPLRERLADASGIRTGNVAAVERLTTGLMMCGFAMQACKSSRPASGADHQFSHLWDMQDHKHNGVAPSHGFKVGIGAINSTRLYEQLLAMPLDQLDVDAATATWPDWKDEEEAIATRFEPGDLRAIAIKETRAKWIDRADLAHQLRTLRQAWPMLRTAVSQQLYSAEKIREMLAAAGAPSHHEQIGISTARLRSSFYQAYHIRRRFTVLDLAMRTATFAPALEQIFSSANESEGVLS